MLYESCASSCEPQVSIELRYVDKSEAKERFIGFIDVRRVEDSDALFKHEVKIV